MHRIALSILLLASLASAVRGAPPVEPAKSPARLWVALPAEPGQHKLVFDTTLGNQKVRVPFVLYLPRGYGQSKERWPAMVYLHGEQERGNIANLLRAGPQRWLGEPPKADPRNPRPNPEPDLRDNLRMVVISPLCPGDRQWTQPQAVAVVLDLIAHCVREFAIDEDRLYLTGAGSMGGGGVWRTALAAPERFAALVPYCAREAPADQIEAKLRHPATWIVAAARDGWSVEAARRLHGDLSLARARVRMSVLADADQNASSRLYAEAGFVDWLLKQRRLSAQERAALDAPPTEPGHYKVFIRAIANNQPTTLPAALFLPPTYLDTRARPGLLIWLHASEQRGIDLKAVLASAPHRQLREDARFRDSQKLVILSPQCPPNLRWDQNDMPRAVLALAEEAARTYRVDPDRISVAGLEMGGSAAWQAALAGPDRFAAVMPIHPTATPPQQEIVAKLKYLAIRLGANGGDGGALAAISSLDENLRVSRCRSSVVGLNFDQMRFLAEGSFHDWFNSQQRLSPKQRAEWDASPVLQPGHYRLKFQAKVGNETIEFPYLVFLPEGYEKGSDKWPMLLFLHGAGEGGNDYNGLYIHGPDGHLRGNADFRRRYKLIQLSPQSTRGWDAVMLKAVAQLVGHVCKTFRVDTDRVFCTGLSMGGTGTWALAMDAPQLFNGIVPICGRQVAPEQAARLKDLNVWIIVGGADGDFTTGAQNMAAALRKTGSTTTQHTVVPNEGHGVWMRYYGDPGFYDWFLKQKRKR